VKGDFVNSESSPTPKDGLADKVAQNVEKVVKLGGIEAYAKANPKLFLAAVGGAVVLVLALLCCCCCGSSAETGELENIEAKIAEPQLDGSDEEFSDTSESEAKVVEAKDSGDEDEAEVKRRSKRDD
jgi:hypothetical protein